MNNIVLIISITTTFFSMGCATEGGSIAAGAALGSGTGAGIGAAVDPKATGSNRVRNVVIGTATGAAIGGATGYFVHNTEQKKQDEAFKKGQEDTKKVIDERMGFAGEPALLEPKTEAIFVDDQVHGNVFIPAHFEYRTIQPARWSRP